MQKFVLYEKAREVNKGIVKLVKSLKLDRYKHDQIMRASNSMVLNIAEGNGRFTSKDKVHYFITARGSVYETISIFDLMEDEELIGSATAEEFREDLLVLIKILTKLIMNMKNNQ